MVVGRRVHGLASSRQRDKRHTRLRARLQGKNRCRKSRIGGWNEGSGGQINVGRFPAGTKIIFIIQNNAGTRVIDTVTAPDDNRSLEPGDLVAEDGGGSE